MTKRAGKKKSPRTTGIIPESYEKATSEHSNWWQLLKPTVRERALAAGGGAAESVKTSQESRLELLAIKSRWPIPTDLKASMVFENARMVIDPRSDPRTKVNASRVLLTMEAMNQRDESPDQIQLTVMNGDQVVQVDSMDMLSAMRQQWSSESPKDSPYYVEPGSEDDYAE